MGGGASEGDEKCKRVKNKYMCLPEMIEGPGWRRARRAAGWA